MCVSHKRVALRSPMRPPPPPPPPRTQSLSHSLYIACCSPLCVRLSSHLEQDLHFSASLQFGIHAELFRGWKTAHDDECVAQAPAFDGGPRKQHRHFLILLRAIQIASRLRLKRSYGDGKAEISLACHRRFSSQVNSLALLHNGVKL